VTPIGTGFDFLSNIVRGFKVHVDVDPDLAPTTLVATNVDIEIARFDGELAVSTAGKSFQVTRAFSTPRDDYSMTLDYISAATTNGKDASGNYIHGFKWWDFAYPTIVYTDPEGITSFESTIGGSVSFGGTIPAIKAWGVSYASWADPANPAGWSADFSILVPIPFPYGRITSAWTPDAGGGSFGMAAVANAGAGNAVTVDASTVVGSATLVYDVNTSPLGIVTVSPEDLTNPAVTAALTAGTYVRVFGVPEADGHIKAYVFFYFTSN
jgi:hypothetical protein